MWPVEIVYNYLVSRLVQKDKLSGSDGKLTCCLKPILSFTDLLVKLDKKDSGNTKAALPTITKAISIELTPTDFPGLQKTEENILATLSRIGKCLSAISKYFHASFIWETV